MRSRNGNRNVSFCLETRLKMNPYFEKFEKIEFYRSMLAREFDPLPSNPYVVRSLRSNLSELLDLCSHDDANDNTILIDSQTINGNSKYCKLCMRHLDPITLQVIDDNNEYIKYPRV